MNFDDDFAGSFDVLLPADICGSMVSTDGCSITGASIDITGVSSPPDNFEDAIHASEDSNGGSVSGHDRNDDMTSGSNFAIDDSGNIHAIWLDNGDLNSEDNFAQDVFYSNWDGNDWSNIIQLSSAAADDYIDTTPQIAVSEFSTSSLKSAVRSSARCSACSCWRCCLSERTAAVHGSGLSPEQSC